MLLELVGTLWEAQKLFFRNVKLMFSIFLLMIYLSSSLLVSYIFSFNQLITDFAHETSLVPAMGAGTPEFPNLLNTLKDHLRLFRLWYLIFTFCFAWLFFTTASISASAVTYCGKDLSIKELLSRTVKSLKRLFLTWFYINLLHLGYRLFFIQFLVPPLLSFDHTFTTAAFSITLFLLALVFQAYLAVVWNLALVVSVLEEICGIEAIGKAEQLIKGSKRRGFSLNILFGALSLSVFCGVLMSENAAMIPLLLLNSMYWLIEMFKLTTYTILYHECKETHGEELEMQEGTEYTKVAFTPLISADAP